MKMPKEIIFKAPETKSITEEIEEMIKSGNAVTGISAQWFTAPWVPTSERLPLMNERVLLSAHDATGDQRVFTGALIKDDKFLLDANAWGLIYDISYVDAWTQLPPPYRLESEND